MSNVLQEGVIFANRYKILRGIAAGGMGAVYEVLHLETARRRALKVMHPHIFQSDDMRARFKREARVAAEIESDFIVDVFDAGVDEATGMPFMVMELLRGEELGKRLTRLGRLSPAEVALYLHQTALALDKTHRAGIVHRDLKPENLFLTEREDGPPRVKVLDFGVAKLLAEGATNGGATQSLGTPLYMSPEQFNPEVKLSGASDIFALGMMAYTLLVGTAYWANEAKANNIYAFVAAAAFGPREVASARAAQLGVTLSPLFDVWFATATAMKADNRFPTATAAARALAAVFGVPLPTAGISPHHGAISESQQQPPVLVSDLRAVLPSATRVAAYPGDVGLEHASESAPLPSSSKRSPAPSSAQLSSPGIGAAPAPTLLLPMQGRHAVGPLHSPGAAQVQPGVTPSPLVPPTFGIAPLPLGPGASASLNAVVGTARPRARRSGVIAGSLLFLAAAVGVLVFKAHTSHTSLESDHAISGAALSEPMIPGSSPPAENTTVAAAASTPSSLPPPFASTLAPPSSGVKKASDPAEATDRTKSGTPASVPAPATSADVPLVGPSKGGASSSSVGPAPSPAPGSPSSTILKKKKPLHTQD